MKKIINISLLASCLVSTLLAEEVEENRDRLHSVKKAIASVHEVEQKELDVVDGFAHMFHDGKVTGQIKTMYSGIGYTNAQDIYATAVGGFLKYELAEYKGFNAGVEFATTNDINGISGAGIKRNNELSSSAGSYTQMSESYINYQYHTLNIRGGRQTIDTPLADSDDIRMVSNSFEAYIVTYELSGFTLMGGTLLSWQGYDADLDAAWQKTGKDGTYFGGASYSDDALDASLWYYNINGEMGDATANNSFYADIVGHFHLSQELSVHLGAQYLKQNELDSSGVASNIYGATAEVVINGLGLNIAYNKSLKESNKQSFSGFGGGTLFTSMDNMIVDIIAVDRDVDAFVSGISYEYSEDLNFLYAYGDFKGDKDSSGVKEHIIEHNIGATYEHNDFILGAIYTLQEDKEKTGINGGDLNNVRVLLSYNF